MDKTKEQILSSSLSGFELFPMTSREEREAMESCIYSAMEKYAEQEVEKVNLLDKQRFSFVEDGVEYQLPVYRVIDGKGIERTGEFQTIKFVRGSKLGDEDVPKHEGVLHETLLAMMIHDLKLKNKLVPSREGSLTITALEEALLRQMQRNIDRIRRDVVGTYQE